MYTCTSDSDISKQICYVAPILGMDMNNNFTLSCPLGSTYESDINKCSIDIKSINAPSSGSLDTSFDMPSDMSTDMSISAPSTSSSNTLSDTSSNAPSGYTLNIINNGLN
jgi:hypothetical protein